MVTATEGVRTRAKVLLVSAVVTAVVTTTLAFGIGALVGDQAEERIDRNTATVVMEIQQVHTLLCEALREAENPALVTAVEENCP